MELRVLTNTFSLDYTISEYVSLIWTERFTDAGDVQLSVVPTAFYLASLSPGRYLGLADSQEVMIIENQQIEGGLLKISGRSMLTVLDQRYVWYPDLASTQSEYPPIEYKNSVNTPGGTSSNTPGAFISNVVWRFAMEPFVWPTAKDGHSLDEATEKIPELSYGAIDSSGEEVELVAPIGTIYDAIVPIAQAYGVGISLYVTSTGLLKFSTYKGMNRTSNQTVNPLLRLSPDMDDISDMKELRSIAGQIDSIYVHHQNSLTRYEIVNGVATWQVPTAPRLARRVKVLHPATTPELYKRTGGGTLTYYSLIKGTPLKTAQYWLDQHKPLHMVDGHMSVLLRYKFGVHYGLGDIIELESAITGAISTAQITEYIRAENALGERSYPTIDIGM